MTPRIVLIVAQTFKKYFTKNQLGLLAYMHLTKYFSRLKCQIRTKSIRFFIDAFDDMILWYNISVNKEAYWGLNYWQYLFYIYHNLILEWIPKFKYGQKCSTIELGDNSIVAPCILVIYITQMFKKCLNWTFKVAFAWLFYLLLSWKNLKIWL